jgi:hypothetical protein
MCKKTVPIDMGKRNKRGDRLSKIID